MPLTQAQIDKRRERLVKILKDEGNYRKYVRLLKKGNTQEAVAMTEDIIERYGQDLQKK